MPQKKSNKTKTQKQPRPHREPTELERETARYFELLSDDAIREEDELGAALAKAGSRVNVDED
jgi:hypothetical protein